MYSFDLLDLFIFVFIVLAIVVGFFRGAFKEFLSFLVWVLSFVGALAGYGFVYGQIQGFHQVKIPIELKEFWVFLVLFLVLFVILSIVRFFITIFVSSLSLGISSRFLGMVFAFLKATLVVYICLMTAHNFVSKDQKVMKESVVLKEAKPYFIVMPGEAKTKNQKSKNINQKI